METKVALCQLLSKSNNPDGNFTIMKKTIKECSQKKVKLCIFPEDFLYGVLRDRSDLLNAGKKFSYWVKRFSYLSKKYRIDIIPGTFPLYENKKIFNTTAYINNKGKILNRYSKTNLWLSERVEYSSSKEAVKCFQSILGKTVIICWDIFDHKLFEAAIKQDVKWIIILSFWSMNQSDDLASKRGKPVNKYAGLNDSKIIDSLIQARISEYNVGIIFCNFAKIHKYIGNTGRIQRSVSAGHTQIVSPFNKIYKRIANRKERILIYDIPSIETAINDFETYYGRRKDVINLYPQS